MQVELDSPASQGSGPRLRSLLLTFWWGSCSRQQPGIGYSLRSTFISETLGGDDISEETGLKPLQ